MALLPWQCFGQRLDKAVLEAFARAIPTNDDTPRIIGYNQALCDSESR
jgi:uncharacterized protein (DUF608 family)